MKYEPTIARLLSEDDIEEKIKMDKKQEINGFISWLIKKEIIKNGDLRYYVGDYLSEACIKCITLSSKGYSDKCDEHSTPF